MKFFTVLACLLSFTAVGQDPDASLILESHPISAGAAAILETDLGAPAVCYRIYAVIPDNYEVQILFGDTGSPMQIASAAGFYQNAFGGPTAEYIDPDAVALMPELAYDSWLTIGDNDALDNQSVLYPNDVVFADWETGADLNISDLFGGGVLIATYGNNPQSTGDVDGKVLLAQLTSTSDVWGSVSFQIRRLNPDGSIYDPPGDDTFEVAVFNDMSFSTVVAPLGCATDLNGDLKTDTTDLLTLIGDYGCATYDCIGDINNSGNVDSADILVSLGAFGTDCE